MFLSTDCRGSHREYSLSELAELARLLAEACARLRDGPFEREIVSERTRDKIAADGGHLLPLKDGCFRINLSASDKFKVFTFDCERAQADEMVELLGLDHPIMSEMLRRWNLQPPDQLGVAVDGSATLPPGVLTIWSVESFDKSYRVN